MFTSYVTHTPVNFIPPYTDPIGRLSLIEAVAHPYLTTGTMSLLEHESPLLMDPLTLHLSTPPVALLTRDSYESPNSNGNSGSACFEDHLWARRQFSVLWAPMPANFTSTTEVTASDYFHLDIVAMLEMLLIFYALLAVMTSLERNVILLSGIPNPTIPALLDYFYG